MPRPWPAGSCCPLAAGPTAGGGEDAARGAPREEAAEESAQSPAPERLFALPDSCDDAGAEELAGDFVPDGASFSESTHEDTDEDTDLPDGAERLSCVWTATDAETFSLESFSLVFFDHSGAEEGERGDEDEEGADPAETEVYTTPDSEAVEGEFEHSSAEETETVRLLLPGDVTIRAMTLFGDAPKEDLEELVLAAAEEARI